MVDVQEGDLALVLLEDHDGRVRELVHLGQVVHPDHARQAAAGGGEPGARLGDVAPGAEGVGPAKGVVGLGKGEAREGERDRVRERGKNECRG